VKCYCCDGGQSLNNIKLFVGFKAILMEVGAAWRVGEDQSHDGEFCSTILCQQS
jgi:hypothetical protein